MRKPKLAVWKFASCDGCQLIAARLRGRIAGGRRRGRDRLFPRGDARRRSTGPYDLSLVEGSVTTRARCGAHPGGARSSRSTLITIGACATAGGIQALRNFADVREFTPIVYARPDYHRDARHLDADHRARARSISNCAAARSTSTSCSRCIAAFLAGRKPATRRRTASASSASSRGNVCVMVAHGTPCLGPVTHAGCGALCPGVQPRLLRLLRPDGNAQHAVAQSHGCASLGMSERDLQRVYQHLQRRPTAVPRGERRAMARKTIKVD